jgi:hypothetical protein
MIRSGKAAARTLLQARILLKADIHPAAPAWSDEAISEALEVPATTMARVRQRFVEEGRAAALRPRPTKRPYTRKLDWRCRSAPAGFSVWSRSGRPSALELAAAGRPTSRVGPHGFGFLRDEPPHPEKNEWPPHFKEYWAIPPEHSAEFVTAREGVLEIYQRPLDPAHSVICMDETSRPPTKVRIVQRGRSCKDRRANGRASQSVCVGGGKFP